MAEERGDLRKIISLLKQAEQLLEEGESGRPRPKDLAEIVHEFERHRLILQQQDEGHVLAYAILFPHLSTLFFINYISELVLLNGFIGQVEILVRQFEVIFRIF